MRAVLAVVACVACSGPDERARPIVDLGGHFFDAPWPDDGRVDAEGRPDLSGFPVSDEPLAASVLGAWVDHAVHATRGFGNNTPAYFRFDGPVALPHTTAGLPVDPVLWIDLRDGTLHPLELGFVEDAAGDPFLQPNTLAVAPALGHPVRSGGRYAVVVLARGGIAPAEGWSLPLEVERALRDLGVVGGAAVATVFTVQDPVADLRALRDDIDARWTPEPVELREVLELSYAQGQTPSGQAATVATVTYADGTTSKTYLDDDAEAEDHTVVFDETWPMVVYEGTLTTWNYQGLAEQPYMSPSVTHILDTDVQTGWMELADGAVQRAPEPEPMRFVVSVPRGADGAATDAVGAVLHDHGTGGHAYNIVQRYSSVMDGRRIAATYADAGWALVGRDATLYGQRYPLIDEGYDASLGFYNIVNTPAFRDNHRQTAVDGYVLARWVAERLDQDLPSGSVDGSRIRRTGHSLGSVTVHNGLALAPELTEAALVSGTGGVFLHYFFDTGLLQAIDPADLELLFLLFGVEAPSPLDTTGILGAVLGVPEAGWGHLDRLHPSGLGFQWLIDPSDPMSLARHEPVPVRVVVSPGDWQTPDFTAEALAEALPDAEVRICDALGDYDPHHCIWREQEGADAIAEWLAE